MSLSVGDTNSGLSKIPLDVEQCECPWGYSGTSCEVRNHFRVTLSASTWPVRLLTGAVCLSPQYCMPGFYRVGGILFGGNCLQCECNDHATECDINGECLVGVTSLWPALNEAWPINRDRYIIRNATLFSLLHCGEDTAVCVTSVNVQKL